MYQFYLNKTRISKMNSKELKKNVRHKTLPNILRKK